jgi:hypothetical protein
MLINEPKDKKIKYNLNQNTLSNTEFIEKEKHNESNISQISKPSIYNINDLSSNISSIDNLLSSSTQWQNVNDIVRITIKHIYDLTKAQNQTIKELERQLNTKATKSELNSGLSIKASNADVVKKLEEINNQIENKVSVQNFNFLLEDKANVVDLEDIKNNIIQQEQRLRDQLKSDMNSLYTDVNNRIKDQDKTSNEILLLLDSKADINAVNIALDTKTSKESLTKDLNNLENTILTDINKLFLINKELQDEFKYKHDTIFEKIDKFILKTTSQLSQIEKTIEKNKQSISQLEANQPRKEEFNLITEKLRALDTDFDKLIENLKSEFNEININIRLNKTDCDALNDKLILINDKVVTFDSDLEEIKKSSLLNNNNYNEKFKDIKVNIELLCDSIEKIDLVKINLSEAEDIISNKINSLFNYRTSTICQSEEFQIMIFNSNEKTYKNVMSDVNSKFEYYNNSLISQMTNTINELKNSNNEKPNIELEINKKIDILSDTMNNYLSLSEKNYNAIQSKLDDQEDINQNFNNGISTLHSRLNTESIEIKRGIEELTITLNKYESESEDFKQEIDNIKLVYNNKADIDDINKALTSIHDELDIKANFHENNKIIDKINVVNSSILKELCLIKVTYSSNTNKTGYLVPWDTQKINTYPDNFYVETDRQSISIAQSGLYEIFICFFSKEKLRKPNFQVLINNNPVINSNSIEELSLFNVKNYLLNDKTFDGLKMYPENIRIKEYFMLNDKSKVSVSFTGEVDYGIMIIKKIN